MLFGRAKKEEWCKLQVILHRYELASGLVLSNEKTTVFFSLNTNEAKKMKILREAGVVACGNYENYLGLPTMVWKSLLDVLRREFGRR